MDINYRKKIISEIEKSGFPLELELIEKLREEEVMTHSNVSFQDTQGVVREIDILATVFSEENDWGIGPSGIQLIIECKKSEKYPWVFFEEVYNPLNNMGLLNRVDYFSEVSSDDIFDSSILNPLFGIANSEMSKHHFNSEEIPIARAFFEAFKKPNEQTSIYKAVNNIFHSRINTKKWMYNSRSSYKSNRTFLIQQTIVVDAQLILARRENGKVTVEPVNHILLTTIDTLADSDNRLLENEIVIDIVHRDYFSDYVKILKEEAWCFNEHLNDLLKSDKWGSPEMFSN